MIDLLFHLSPALASLGIGMLLIFWPPPKHAAEEEMRQKRLAELRAGEEERYSEERRELEAYGPNSAGPFRFWGFLLLLLSIPLLFA